MKLILLVLITFSSSFAHAEGEVDAELRKKQLDEYKTEQYITTGASLGVNATLELNRRRLLKKSKIVSAELKAAETEQKAAERTSKKAKARGKQKAALSLRSAEAELKLQKKASFKNRWGSRLNIGALAASGYFSVKSALANIYLWNKDEEDCCTVTEVAGDPSDVVAQELSELAQPIMHSYKNKTEQKDN
ncbi:MAG: hypothetical protein ACJAS4_002512 [Bacteriovoracaceae bacterium]|jgi:hypothetical protein